MTRKPKKANQNLTKAKEAKQDEFYTQLADIEKELRHYKKHFRGKVVYCNCDDPKVSNFFQFFLLNFEQWGLKRLIATCYKSDNPDERTRNGSKHAVCLDYSAHPLGTRRLEGDGDFRSDECVELLKQADIVVTNPPFSLFREYVAQLVEHGKKFLIIGNLNSATCKEIFPLVKDGKLWFGPSIHSGDREFQVPDHYPLAASGTRIDSDGKKYIRVKGVRWFTNLDHKDRHEDLVLYKTYTPKEYPKYDNYDAINVDKTKDIPVDYDGVMGVPITFLDKHNPDQFKIVSSNDVRVNSGVPFKAHGLVKDKDGTIDGKPTYVRILIRRRK